MAREQVEAAQQGRGADRARRRGVEPARAARRVAGLGARVRRPAAPRHDAVARGAARLLRWRSTKAATCRSRSSAIPHLQRAIELDPNFALALAALSGVYANTSQTALAPVYSKRAFELRDRVSERERYIISWRYYRDALQDWAKALELARAWTDGLPARGVRVQRARPGRRAARPARREPRSRCGSPWSSTRASGPPKGNLADNLLRQNKLDDAMKRRDAVHRRRASTISALYRVGYLVSLLRDDPAGMRRLPRGRAQDRATCSTCGQLGGARQRVLRPARRGPRRPHAVRSNRRCSSISRNGRRAYSTEDAEIHAIVGRCTEARRAVRAALDWSRDRPRWTSVPARSAGAVTRRRSSSTREMAQRFPNASLRLHVSVPIETAAYMVRTGNLAGRADRARSGEALRGRHDGQAVAGVPARPHLHWPARTRCGRRPNSST